MSEINNLQLLSKLVTINSVYPNEIELSKFIENYLSNLGYKIDIVVTNENRNNLIATLGSSNKYLGFYGHMDTVPPAKDYEFDPFIVHEKEGIVRGLGVCDMKGGLTCILQLAKYAKEQNLPVKLIFGVDEENISEGAHDLVDSGLLNDVSFLIVAESGQIKNFNQPISLCVGRKGRIVFEVEVKGKTAHAAESEKAVNAILKASQLIQEISQLSFKAHPKLGKPAVIIQEINSSTDGFSIPDSCTLKLSLLSVPGFKSGDFVKIINDVAEKNNINIAIKTTERVTPYGEAYELDLQNNFYLKLKKEILGKLNLDELYTPSVADENVFANRLSIPVLTLGVIGAGDHTKDEWARLSSYDELISVYSKILRLYNN
jgi:acetylornithine deacetylase/succinyl-diaminopimelate desuccinylase-like protein